MERKLYVLGTSSLMPTKHRNHNGYLLEWDEEGFLFDPGEGTQRQMVYAGVSVFDITKLFISHFHGDHCLGLAGLIQRIARDEVPHTIEMYYPASGQKYFDNLRNASIYKKTPNIKPIPVEDGGVICQRGSMTIEALPLKHKVPTLGYRIKQENSRTMLPNALEAAGIKGPDIGKLKKEGFLDLDGQRFLLEDFSDHREGQSFAFVMDTGICSTAYALARNVDMLLCESTYLKTETEEAGKRMHLTAEQAASIAKESNANLLVLSHYSQMYPDSRDFAIEAQAVHPNSVAAQDGDVIPVPKRP